MASKKLPRGSKVEPIAQVDPNAVAYAVPTDPLKSPADPRVVYRDVPAMSYTGDWEVSGVAAALDAHKNGQFAQAALLADDLYGDDRVQATLGSRTSALFGKAPVFTRAPSDDGGQCLDAWRDQYRSVSAEGVLGAIKRQAILLGFSVSEILWDTTVEPWKPYLKPWPARYVYFRWDIRRLVASTANGPVVIEPGDGKWFVHAPHGVYRGWIHATIRSIADLWLIKKLAWRDWARFNERHGLPIIKAFVPAAGDAAQKEAFVQGLSTLGQEAVVGLPQNVDETGYDLELLEARDRAFDTFGKTIEAVDRSIILAIKSQNLTTEVSEGSFAAARQHGGTEQAALEFDEKTFSEDIYEQLARPFALFNFGDADLAPTTHWAVEPEEDRAAKAKTQLDAASALKALREQGIAVDIAQFCTSYGIPTLASEIDSKIGQIFAYHLDAGVVTINEVRASIGLPPIEGGEDRTAAAGAPAGGGGFSASSPPELLEAIKGLTLVQGKDGPPGPPGPPGDPGPRGEDGHKSEPLSAIERYAHFTAALVELRGIGAELSREDVERIASIHDVDPVGLK